MAFTIFNGYNLVTITYKTLSDDTFTNLQHLSVLDLTETFFAYLPQNEELVPLQSLKDLSTVSSSLISLRIGKSFGNLTSLRRLVLNAETNI